MKANPFTTALMLTLSGIACACGDLGTMINNNDVCDAYPPMTESEYVLPFRPGESYKVHQENCSRPTHYGSNAFAYDLEMPIGTPIVAMRQGKVLTVKMSSENNSVASAFANMIFIEHADGTVAFYEHLAAHSASVVEGQTVNQGDTIALSGSSGTTFPHLHFCVFKNSQQGHSVPLSFRNTSLHSRGLRSTETYTALPY